MIDHWNQHARQWQWIASPLRPSPEDIAFIERTVSGWHRKNQATGVNAALLGVTPEIALMRWPASTKLVAIDHSQAMIDGVWPGNTLTRVACCADWAQLPLPDASQHIIIGDGCFNALLFPDQYRAAVEEVRRVLLDNGIFVIRFFLRPEVTERVDTVVGDLLRGRIGNFHVFKWRLAMALHAGLEKGVRLADIWDAWHGAVPDPELLAVKLDWPREVLQTIDNYRNVETRYTFPTLAEARAALASALTETESFSPPYELGNRCPTLVFRRTLK